MINFPLLIFGAVFALIGVYTLIDGLRGYIHIGNRSMKRGRQRFEDVLPKVQPIKSIYLALCAVVLLVGLGLLASALAPAFG